MRRYGVLCITLATSGLFNRQIADRLTASIRTVEGHLYRACTNAASVTAPNLLR